MPPAAGVPSKRIEGGLRGLSFVQQGALPCRMGKLRGNPLEGDLFDIRQAKASRIWTKAALRNRAKPRNNPASRGRSLLALAEAANPASGDFIPLVR